MNILKEIVSFKINKNAFFNIPGWFFIWCLSQERERKEQELKAKLEERNKKAEMVRQNKEKLQLDLGPESA